MTRTGLRAVAWLVSNGLTLSEVDSMNDAEITAWSVAFGEAKGGKWSWDRMCWEEEA